jgi:hypothetical protein
MLLAHAHRRLRAADAALATTGATVTVARAYRDAYKAFAFLGATVPEAQHYAGIAAERANRTRDLL